MTDSPTPPALVPQSYPLWCAELSADGDTVEIGRVVAWDPASRPGMHLAPLIAREHLDSRAVYDMNFPVINMWGDPDSVLFFADSRAEALGLAAAYQAEQAKDDAGEKT